MPTAIPELWSNDIKVDVLPPIAILKVQEGSLARKTQGMLQAKLTSTETESLVQHQLDLIAPSLNFYRERLLSVTHDMKMPYPVAVRSEFFPKPLRHIPNLGVEKKDPSERRAATSEEFVKLVGEVLQSDGVRALIHSLIARINQEKADRQAIAGPETTGQLNDDKDSATDS